MQRYWTKAAADGAEKRKATAEDEAERAERKKEHEKTLACECKQRERERKKEAAAEEDDDTPPDSQNANKVLMNGAVAVAAASAIDDVANLSQPATQGWKKSRNGTQGGVVRNAPSKRVFWFHPFLWVLIEAALRRRNWSAGEAVKDLHRLHPQLFNAPNSTLHRGTLWKWIVAGEKHFTDAVLRSVVTRRTLVGSGRVGVLAKYPQLVEKIVTTLRDLRTSGCVVNVPIARSLMLAIITDHDPEILHGFKCSEKFVRSFLESILDWTSRKATRAAKHIPENTGELCERTFFRLAHAIESEHIPAKLVINYDQTGNYLLPNNSQTFEQRGAKQVSVIAKDEKHAYTLGIATAANGTILPLEQVWAGKTKTSLPNEKADGYQTANQLGFLFSSAASEKKTSHFSTQKTMREWVQKS